MFRHDSFSPRKKTLFLCVGLTAFVLVAFWRVLSCDFLIYDDWEYVVTNDMVRRGLTAESVAWAFTKFHSSNWHPLTWISHMADVQCYGLRPLGHHLTNLILHTVNTLLLFGLLRRLTGSLWRSAVVAALFGLHPTHVESVAWVAERKDVLSTCFGLLTLLAYVRFARPSTLDPRPSTAFAFLRAPAYWLTFVLLACGLMSKPMLVTWPCVMLLLDFWPLNRISLKPKVLSLESWKANQRLLVEKIPFFALTIGSCVLTFFAQRAGGAVQSMEHLPVGARVANAVVAYARYLGKTIWPAELSAYYPHPIHWPDGVVLGAGLLLVGLAALGWWLVRTQRYVLFGLCWFLGTLVPVIGLIQVGGQSIADRYLYIPQIGILIAGVWGAAALAARHRIPSAATAALAGAAILSCGFVTRHYLPKWQNSVALFEHALTVDPQNPPALYSLGLALCADNKYAEALPYLEKAAALSGYAPAYQGQLALAYESLGNIGGAIERYRKCLELLPDLPEALNNLAWLLATSPEAKHRNGADAVRFATRACELTQYDWPMFLGTLAASYAEAGRFPEAIATAEKAEAMARKRGFTELADRNAELLKVYRAGQPHREAATP